METVEVKEEEEEEEEAAADDKLSFFFSFRRTLHCSQHLYLQNRGK